MGDCLEFGIISRIEHKKDYSLIAGPDGYKELHKQYHCVSVPDEIMNDWIPLMKNLPTYACSLSKKHMGIDHYGVTIIPPESVKILLHFVRSYMNNNYNYNESVEKLISLLNVALENCQYIICYGI